MYQEMKVKELISLFKQARPEIKSHMKNLLEIAMADNDYSVEEQEFLQELAKKYKISGRELVKIQNKKEEIFFEIPEDENEKFEQFYELIKMMTVDNRIEFEEESLCKIFARKFGYVNRHDLVKAVTQNILHGQPCEETRMRVNMLL
jgi:hydroxylamine reductase (hybrid-cluster protein)